MAYRFIVGAAGSGKTTRAIDYLFESVKSNPDLTHLYIVPEQFTLSTQRALVDRHENHSVMDINILSFNRLAFYVFKELGTESANVLEETGKTLIIRKLLSDKASSLNILSDYVSNYGYINEIKSIISEFMQYKVTPEKLAEINTDSVKNGLLYEKLKDIGIIYEAFLEAIRGEYTTPELMLDLLSEKVSESKLLKDAVIVFDGFTGFTPIQNEIVRKLLDISKELIFTITIEKEALNNTISKDELFFMSKNYMSQIREASSLVGHQKENDIIILNEKRYPRNVEILELSNPKEELLYTASKIKDLVMNGLRYKEIAVLCANQEIYEPYIKSIFEEYNIPVFIDKSATLTTHPLINLLLNTQRIITNNFLPKDVISFIKTGLTDVEPFYCDMLENYLNATGIRGFKAYSNDFKKRPFSLSDNELCDYNREKDVFIAPLKVLYEKYKNKNSKYLVHDMNVSIYEFMETMKIEDKLYQNEESDIYNLVIEVLEKCESFLGKELMTFKDYMDTIITGISSSKLKGLPKSSDMIVFGDTVRTRLENINTLITIGANDGVLPSISSPAGILNENDRSRLLNMDLSLSPLERERQFEGSFYMYLMETIPYENLILTYSAVSLGGDELRPSFVIKEIATRNKISFSKGEVLLNSRSNLKKELTNLLNTYQNNDIEDDEKLISVLSYFNRYEKDVYEAIKDFVFSSKDEDPLSESLLREIDNYLIQGSVSRLESYSRCSYAYYLNYILSLKEKPEYGLKPMDIGNIYHEGLYAFFTLLKGQDVLEINDTNKERLIDEAMEIAYSKIQDYADYDTPIHNYEKGKIKETLYLNINTLIDQIKKSDFRPTSFEVSLSEILSKEDLIYELSNGTKLKLNGKIDRIDTKENEDSVLIKVIDYKTGSNDFSINKLNAGLQIQLIYYLNAKVKEQIKKNPEKRVIPAAFFYYHIDNPINEVNRLLREGEFISKLKKSLIPVGVAANDESVLKSIDTEIAEKLYRESFVSDVMKLNLKTNGDVDSRSDVMAIEDIEFLMDFTDKKVKEIAEDMSRANFVKNPYRITSQDYACRFCSYKPVCSFNHKDTRDSFKDIEPISNVDKLRDKYGD